VVGPVKTPWLKSLPASLGKYKPKKSSKKVTLKSALIYLFNCYLCFLLAGLFVVCVIRDKIALFPMQNTDWKPYLPEMATKLKVEPREMFIPGPNKTKLAALLVTKPGSKYIYLVSHGNGGNLGFRMGLAAYLVASGQSVFMYDYEGYGESSGEAKLVNLTPDGLAAYDYLVGACGYKPDQIILYGESIGTGVTTGIMSERKARAVILQSGFTSLVDAAKDRLWQLKIFPDWAVPAPHLDNLSAVKRSHPPLLFIHGTLDQILPVRYSRTMYAEALEPKRYYEIDGAEHNNIGATDTPGFCNTLTAFIASLENNQKPLP
jgi:pimeloyl-ACP methyl ester carboxylesterase